MSIKEEINGEIIANSLCLDPLPEYYVLVEGETDELFYSKFLNDDKCLIEICHGKQNVLDAISILDARNKKVNYLGLVDKDYDFINKSTYSSNIIKTDAHSVETMCVSSESFNNVINEYFDSEKIEKIEKKTSLPLVSHLLNLAKEIAGIRIISQIDGYNFQFKPSETKPKELEYAKFICKENFTFLGLDTLLESIKRYYNQAVGITNNELSEKIEQLDLDQYELLNLCHGHDLSRIIVVGLKKAIGKNATKTASIGEIERALRLAYTKDEFYQTDIKKQIDAISLGLVK